MSFSESLENTAVSRWKPLAPLPLAELAECSWPSFPTATTRDCGPLMLWATATKTSPSFS